MSGLLLPPSPRFPRVLVPVAAKAPVCPGCNGGRNSSSGAPWQWPTAYDLGNESIGLLNTSGRLTTPMRGRTRSGEVNLGFDMGRDRQGMRLLSRN